MRHFHDIRNGFPSDPLAPRVATSIVVTAAECSMRRTSECLDAPFEAFNTVMRVVINSDILYSMPIAQDSLPDVIRDAFRAIKGAGGVIVLPRTTLLEYERKQTEVSNGRAQALRQAVGQFQRYGIRVEAIDPDALTRFVPFTDLLRDESIAVEVEDATIEDYREAERRACLHLAPQPSGKTHDEMRDLVIWSIAMRVAQKDGRAVLVSGDQVHVGPAGDTEAQARGLQRVKGLDEALELLGRESPAGILARTMLESVARPLALAGLPIPERPDIKSLSDLSFVTDAAGYASGQFLFEVQTDQGVLRAHILIQRDASGTVLIELTNVLLASKPWTHERLSIKATVQLPSVRTPAAADLGALRDIIGEGK
jgi:hypothetical protein